MNKLSLSIALTCVVAVSWGCTEARTADLKPPTPVKVQSVEAFSANNSLRYSATIRPASQMELAFRNGGFVQSIHHVGGRLIDKGDTVTKGATLAGVRQSDFEDRMNHSASQLNEARSIFDSAKAKSAENRARFERAEQDFMRAEQLFGLQSLTKANYDAARSEYEAARSKVEASVADVDAARSRIAAAESLLAEARLALQDTALVAPMSGTILERTVEIGSLIAAGKPVFTLADTRTVKAVFGVPDLEIRNIKVGLPLDVTSEAAPERLFRGRITSVSPAADEKSRIFETEVTIPNPGDVLKVGMIASVVIGNSPSTEKFAAVPLSAIVRSNDSKERYGVFVVEDSNGQSLARLRAVELGDAFGNMIVVKQGLTIGESVITVGATLVEDGSAVQIVP